VTESKLVFKVLINFDKTCWTINLATMNCDWPIHNYKTLHKYVE